VDDDTPNSDPDQQESQKKKLRSAATAAVDVKQEEPSSAWDKWRMSQLNAYIQKEKKKATVATSKATATAATTQTISPNELFAIQFLKANSDYNFSKEEFELNRPARQYISCHLPWIHVISDNFAEDQVANQLLKFINKRHLARVEGTEDEKVHAIKQLFLYFCYTFKLVPSEMYKLLLNYKRNLTIQDDENPNALLFKELDVFFKRNLNFSPSSFYCYLVRVEGFNSLIST
jgi:hypothetical protein